MASYLYLQEWQLINFFAKFAPIQDNKENIIWIEQNLEKMNHVADLMAFL